MMLKGNGWVQCFSGKSEEVLGDVMKLLMMLIDGLRKELSDVRKCYAEL